MQIDGVYLMPQTNSTNTAPETSQMLNENSSFQAQLDAATDKLNKTSPTITTMTAEEVAQRNEDIKKASVQLEAIMLKMMYNEMWKTVPKNELFSDGNDNAMEIYRDMYNEELTKAAAEGGGIGLADFIYRQLTETDPHKLY
ncbi:MAG: rod-binding protein [Selenomonadaceae bacterium]|nr:rod-binding protein [Selenomonadaceae bacterium]MBR4382829.1 rod-binding protein [Selenomonadaceae bacterium]